MSIQDNIAFVRKAAADGMVLLKNDNNVLPLHKNDHIALFGRCQVDTFKCGSGSGEVLSAKVVSILEGLENANVSIHRTLAETYRNWSLEHRVVNINRQWNNWTHSLPEMPLTEELADIVALECNKAIVVIGRVAGEALDIENKKGDFQLTEEELRMLKLVVSKFKHVILLLNTPGLLDLGFLEKINVDSILQTFLSGQETGNAVADILTGKVCPSGKLVDTWAKRYEDYPTTRYFSEKEIIYEEGIYCGYRYFDTFGIEPLYPFGFGMSYTDFSIKVLNTSIENDQVCVLASVTNIGNTNGREVVQCYLSCPDKNLDKEYQQLAGFRKTLLLKPGDAECIKIVFQLADFAAYSEYEAAYILEAGKYIVRIGNSSRNTHVAAVLTMEQTCICKKVQNRLTCKEKINIIKKDITSVYSYYNEQEEIETAPVLPVGKIEPIIIAPFENTVKNELCIAPEDEGIIYTFSDLINGRATVEQIIAQFSNRELCLFINGDNPGERMKDDKYKENVGSMSRNVPGAGGQTFAFEKYKIPTSVVQDGPAGLRLSPFISADEDAKLIDYGPDCTSFPSATTIASTWDCDIARELGEHLLFDFKRYRVNGVCGPGLNIHRNPLCGRNFEYFSEDPYIVGVIAANVIQGFQEYRDGNLTGYYAVIKHFAANEQENYRLCGNSVISERALREIYLKGFEIAIKKSNPKAIMTGYNKINGTFASNQYDLCNAIARGEWGFDGIIMTDWNCEGSTSKMPQAGNDLIMPGGHINEEEITNGNISRIDLQNSAVHILKLLLYSAIYQDNKSCEKHL